MTDNLHTHPIVMKAREAHDRIKAGHYTAEDIDTYRAWITWWRLRNLDETMMEEPLHFINKAEDWLLRNP